MAPRHLDDGGGGAVVRLLAFGHSSTGGAEAWTREGAKGVSRDVATAASQQRLGEEGAEEKGAGEEAAGEDEEKGSGAAPLGGGGEGRSRGRRRRIGGGRSRGRRRVGEEVRRGGGAPGKREVEEDGAEEARSRSGSGSG